MTVVFKDTFSGETSNVTLDLHTPETGSYSQNASHYTLIAADAEVEWASYGPGPLQLTQQITGALRCTVTGRTVETRHGNKFGLYVHADIADEYNSNKLTASINGTGALVIGDDNLGSLVKYTIPGFTAATMYTIDMVVHLDDTVDVYLNDSLIWKGVISKAAGAYMGFYGGRDNDTTTYASPRISSLEFDDDPATHGSTDTGDEALTKPISLIASQSAQAEEAFSHDPTPAFANTAAVTEYRGYWGNPSWVSVDSVTGVASGTPTTDGSVVIVVEARNSANDDIWARQYIPVSIAAASASEPPKKVLPLPNPQHAAVGLSYKLDLSKYVTGATSYSATGLPAWATLNTSTGKVTGTPGTNDTGDFPVTFTATNADGSVNFETTYKVANTTITLSQSSGTALRARNGAYISTRTLNYAIYDLSSSTDIRKLPLPMQTGQVTTNEEGEVLGLPVQLVKGTRYIIDFQDPNNHNWLGRRMGTV